MSNRAKAVVPKRSSRLTSPAGLVLLATALLSLSFLFFVNRFGVNVLFFDQWDLLEPLFEGKNLWETFLWQHGPHRQGIGGVLTSLVLNATRWDTVCEG